MEREVIIYPGYDKRKTGDGWQGAEILFVMRGDHGAVTFSCFTDIMPKEMQLDLISKRSRISIPAVQPHAPDYTFHYDRPLYTSQQNVHNKCPYMPEGVTCYSGDNRNVGERLRDLLIDRGSGAVWAAMEIQYRDEIRIVGGKA